MWLYYWEKYGYEKAEQIFKRDYIADKGHVKNINAHLVNVLDGKLEFLKMVKGSEDGTYKGLKERFNELTVMKGKKDNEKIDLESVVNMILNKGIDEGINLYDRFKNS
jgi:RNA-directed DNA polymerase